MPSPSIRSSAATQTAAAATSIPVARASSVSAGDVLVIHLGYTGALGTITAAPGWTLWQNQTNGSLVCQAWYWRIAARSDLSALTYTFTFGASTTIVAHCHAVRDCDDDPVNWLKVQTTGTSTGPNTTALVAQEPGTLKLWGVSTRTVTDATPPTSYTELLDTSSTTGTPNLIRIEDATLVQAADGTTGTPTGTIGSSQAWVASLIVIPSADYPRVRGTPTTGTTTTTSAAVTVPVGTMAGELRLVGIKIPNQTSTVTTPSGWTLIGPQASNATGAFRVYWFYKLAGGTAGMLSTDATQTFTLSAAATTTAWQSISVKRVSQIAPVGATALDANAATATNYAHPGVTTSMEASDRVQATAGATGTLTATSSVTGFSVGLALEVKYGAAPTLPTGINYRSTGNANGGSAQTTIAVPKPTGAVEDDVLEASISGVASGVTITGPAGWTAVAAASGTNTNTNHRLQRFTKRLGPGDLATTTYTFTFTVASSTQGLIHAYAGVTTSDPPVDTASFAFGNSTTATATSVTVANANSALLFQASNFSAAYSGTTPASMAARFVVNNQFLADQIVAAGATGTKTSTIATDNWTASLLVLIPAGAATAGRIFPSPQFVMV